MSTGTRVDDTSTGTDDTSVWEKANDSLARCSGVMLLAAVGSSGDALLEAAGLEETLFLYGARLAFSRCSLELLLATCGGIEAPPKNGREKRGEPLFPYSATRAWL